MQQPVENFSDNNIRDLTTALRSGDSIAFTKIYYLFKDKIFAFAFRFLRSEDLSKEMVQQTFVKLWDVRETVDPELSLNAFLYRIAKNLLLDHIRRYQKETKLSSKEYNQKNDSTIEDAISFEEAAKMEVAIVSGFPRQRQEIYKMRRHEQLSYQEIADKLGVSKNTVKTHLKLAVKELKKKFLPYSHLYFLCCIIPMLLEF